MSICSDIATGTTTTATPLPYGSMILCRIKIKLGTIGNWNSDRGRGFVKANFYFKKSHNIWTSDLKHDK